jgi:hypothetical protein
MKFFIILTVLVSGLSGWANGVMSLNTEVTDIADALNFSPQPAKRGIASTSTGPSCPDSDPNCGLMNGGPNSEAGVLANGTRVGASPILATHEMTTNKNVTADGPARPVKSNNNPNDGSNTSRGN